MNERSKPEGASPQEHAVSITVNGRPVEVAGPHTTGAAIKAAAITAGIQMDMGFQLLEESPNGRTQVVGDADSVQVHKGSKFLALAPDDNS